MDNFFHRRSIPDKSRPHAMGKLLIMKIIISSPRKWRWPDTKNKDKLPKKMKTTKVKNEDDLTIEGNLTQKMKTISTKKWRCPQPKHEDYLTQKLKTTS